MRRTTLDPTDRQFARAVAVEHADHTRVYLSGEVAMDGDGEVVAPGDMEAQARYVYGRIGDRLREEGGSLSDVVRVRVFVTELDGDAYAAHAAAREEAFPEPETYPASTLLEVSRLVDEELLIEVEAEAILPDDGWEARTG